jgi:hypothetical protein
VTGNSSYLGGEDSLNLLSDLMAAEIGYQLSRELQPLQLMQLLKDREILKRAERLEFLGVFCEFFWETTL